MNNNKQQTKGNKMRKIAMIIGVLTVMATSARVGYTFFLRHINNDLKIYHFYNHI